MGMKKKLLKRGFHRCDDTPVKGYPRYDTPDRQHRVTKYARGWRYTYMGGGTGVRRPFACIEELDALMGEADVHPTRRRVPCQCEEARA
jgi:hypothetical protein